MTILAPELTGGVVVAYLVEGRLKLPEGAPTFDNGDDETTQPPPLPPGARKVLPVPATQATPPAAAQAPAAGP
jgi:hypothetical protein